MGSYKIASGHVPAGDQPRSLLEGVRYLLLRNRPVGGVHETRSSRRVDDRPDYC